MQKAGKRCRGFTLIELMIVVAIIAIIASIAIPSLLRSRMAANEIAALQACKAYAEAQEIYNRTDYTRCGVLQYSQHLSGTNSLLGISGELALIDKAFGMAEGQPNVAISRAGYVFTVVTSQGSAATGGPRNYVVNSYMTRGYSFSAIPTAWDNSGRNSFTINNNGVIFQTDQGSTTAHISLFNPDTNWVPAQ